MAWTLYSFGPQKPLELHLADPPPRCGGGSAVDSEIPQGLSGAGIADTEGIRVVTKGEVNRYRNILKTFDEPIDEREGTRYRWI